MSNLSGSNTRNGKERGSEVAQQEDFANCQREETLPRTIDVSGGVHQSGLQNSLRQVPFAEWATVISQRLNRSLAGSKLRINTETDALTVAQAQQWGMSTQIVPDTRISPDTRVVEEPYATFDFCDECEKVTDVSNSSASAMIDFARDNMPVLRTLIQELAQEVSFAGMRIATSLIIEPKTAIFLEELAAQGAQVGVYCGPDSTNQRVADELRTKGIIVEADTSWNAEECHQAALRLLDTIQPHIIVDDGASFARLATLERPNIAKQLIGVAEETTSGVRAFIAMDNASELEYPVIAVNDSQLKTGFDNAHGTGETCVTTFLRILGPESLNNKQVVIFGFGPVGEGFATRARALGAKVTICDTDPVSSLRAVFQGFPAYTSTEVLADADVVVSATGVRHTITLEHMRQMKESAVLAVIGGIANELALDEISDFHSQTGRELTEIEVPGGPKLQLMSEGDGINYTSGGGNPIEVMDLSFAVQASAVAYLIQASQQAKQGERKPLAHHVLRLDHESDQRIARIALEVRGFSADTAVASVAYDWHLTRFSDRDSSKVPAGDLVSEADGKESSQPGGTSSHFASMTKAAQ